MAEPFKLSAEFTDRAVDSHELNCSEEEKRPRRTPCPPSEIKRLIAQYYPNVIQDLCRLGVHVESFTTAVDVWRYADGRVEREDISDPVHKLRGNTDKLTNTIRLNAKLPCKLAAVVLFHEMRHRVRPERTGREAGLQEEIDVRVEEEQFRIHLGLGPSEPGYRLPDGTIDRDAITRSIMGSNHYNPNPNVRQHIGRAYAGQHPLEGFCPP